jgi:hypothetical protein
VSDNRKLRGRHGNKKPKRKRSRTRLNERSGKSGKRRRKRRKRRRHKRIRSAKNAIQNSRLTKTAQPKKIRPPLQLLIML